MTACTHPDPYWRPGHGINEDGWQCESCGAELGFRPDLDREYTYAKVRGILLDFHESKLIYISNGQMGDIVAWNVASRCEQDNLYDQHTILAYILADPNMRTHAPFWANRATRYLMGGEPIRNEQEALAF